MVRNSFPGLMGNPVILHRRMFLVNFLTMEAWQNFTDDRCLYLNADLVELGIDTLKTCNYTLINLRRRSITLWWTHWLEWWNRKFGKKYRLPVFYMYVHPSIVRVYRSMDYIIIIPYTHATKKWDNYYVSGTSGHKTENWTVLLKLVIIVNFQLHVSHSLTLAVSIRWHWIEITTFASWGNWNYRIVMCYVNEEVMSIPRSIRVDL